MKVLIQSKRPGNTKRGQYRHIPEDLNLQEHSYENPKHNFKYIYKFSHVPLHTYIDLHEFNIRRIFP